MHQVACSLCAVHVSGRWIEEGHWLTSVMQMIWWDCVPLRNEMRRWRSVAPKCLRSWFSREITLYWCLHLSPYISPLVMFDDLRVHLFRPPYFFSSFVRSLLKRKALQSSDSVTSNIFYTTQKGPKRPVPDESLMNPHPIHVCTHKEWQVSLVRQSRGFCSIVLLRQVLPILRNTFTMLPSLCV